MKTVIIGGVAAGTKAAAKIKRADKTAEVVIYTKSKDISYAGCGLPYYVGGSIETREELVVNTPSAYMSKTEVEVKTGMEAVCVDPSAKSVSVKNLASGEVNDVAYDRLVIATGAVPFVPEVTGVDLDGVFTMRTPDDAVGLRSYIENNNCRSAVVVGGGFIGLEIAENLFAKGLGVTVIDMADQLMPGIFDADMAGHIAGRLKAKGIRIRTSCGLKGISGADKADGVICDSGKINADVVVLAIGIRPATAFLKDSGIEMVKGAIKVDGGMKTNLPDIYAVGDCALVSNRITGKEQWSAMGSTANIAGRMLAKNLTGSDVSYAGCMGTGVVKLLSDLNAGRTGLTEAAAKEAGYDVVTVTCVTDDKAHYYEDADTFATKLIADKASGKLLGIQVVGSGAVDKMVDIAVCGIALGAKLSDYDDMDFAYAPPFSTAIHPFVQAVYVLENKIAGEFETFTPAEYAAGKAKDYKVIDSSPKPTITGAAWVDFVKVNEENPDVAGAAKDDKLLLVCAKGKRGYFLQNRMKALGYTNTRVLEGGLFMNDVKPVISGEKLPPEEIKRLKGLGCLQDKRFNDVFNVRVITRNGKITSDEHKAVAEAAEIFGTGEVTMTTRLTLEIQGVKYANVAPLIEFLNERGLETGGTGSLVRPVVSCKGTTCQYGLLDSYGISEKLHEIFYNGYHGVTLPHKFKIAVGGCPNNCVKPALNDLGIVGQRVPTINPDKCRGCKVCQVVNACPIKIATTESGKIEIDPEACNNCGRCMSKCPFDAIDYTDGYRVYIGGRWGKKVAHGVPLTKIFTTEEELVNVVEDTILLFRDEGITGERLSDTVARLGFDYVNDKLINHKIDKTAALTKKVKGGATC
ncbi:MAG: FAD-dependent oxidoreductase [Clostridiales bacterium]|nr:FAD-dependent oxidoreductase [Clostridiales bacterium]